MAARTTLNPGRLAHLEAGGWRAYYDRNWPKLIGLMVQLNQEQFHIPFPLSVVAAFHLIRIAQDCVNFAPAQKDVNRDDPSRARRLDAVINGVLQQRLQNERGHQCVTRHVGDMPVDL